MKSFAAQVLLALAAGANAQRGRNGPNPQQGGDTCRGNPVGFTCPSNDDVCFNTNQVVTMGAAGQPWTVDITQCIKSGAVSFITWSPVDANGGCTASCGGNKVEEVQPGTVIFNDLVIPADSCTGTPICVYAHDGSFQKGSGNPPLQGVPEGCFSSANQLCAMCSYIVTPRRTSGSCNNGIFCDGEDVCNGDAVCVPAAADAEPCTTFPLGGADPKCNDPVCDVDQDACVIAPRDIGTPCEDGEFCNGAEACNAVGVCEAADPDPCDDFNVGSVGADALCNDPACDEAQDKCIAAPVSAGTACDDGVFCNGAETCDGSGTCSPGTTVTCADVTLAGDPGCSEASCSETAGDCVESPMASGTACGDGVFCNGAETCDGSGTCSPGTTVTCAEPTADLGCSEAVCEEDGPGCVENIFVGRECDDGDPGTTGDTCDVDGMCVGDVVDPCPGPCQTSDPANPGQCLMRTGLSCDNPGFPAASCFCDESVGGAAPECSICVSDCPGVESTDPRECNVPGRGCAERESQPGSATCGSVTCSILCRLGCGGEGDYDSNLCNNAGGCQCGGNGGFPAATSVFTGEDFNGPCCRCNLANACP